MRILGVRGIYDEPDNARSFVGKLLDPLKDEHEVIEVEYPFMTAIGAYSGYWREAVVNAIAGVAQPGDALIAHSFGGWAAIRGMQQNLLWLSTVFLFAPAADADFELPPDACKRMYVIRSEDDRALEIGQKLPSHIFGPLGLTGYAGKDTRIVNVPARGYDHSDHTRPENIAQWVDFIKRNVPLYGD